MMAAAGDYRVLQGERSKVGLMEVDLGLAPPIRVVQMLNHVFGGRVAERLLSSGRLLSPESALGLGVVDELVDTRENLIERARSETEVLAAKPQAGYRRVKRCSRGQSAALMQHLDELHNAEFVEQWFDPDTQRLIRAAVKKMQS